MNGFLLQGRTPIFEIEGWTNNGKLHTFTGKLIVYSRKVSKSIVRPFRVNLKGSDLDAPLLVRGSIQKCVSSELIILAE
jgi:hypothetical protein